MRKKSMFLWSLLAAMTMSACSEHNELPSGEVPGGNSKANFIVKLNFEGTSMEQGGKTRAAQSTAVPETSWSKIRQVQILLYDASNIVRFSDVVNPTDGNTTFTYTDVPAGTYTMVAIANAKSSADAINTYLDGGTTPVEWGMWNVRQKQVQNMVMKYKTGTFPAFCVTALAGNTAYTEPAEIFMGAVPGVVISSDATATPSPIALKREVSLMRVRLNVKDKEGNTNNENTAKGVDFTQDASIMIYRLPDYLKVMAGNDGGVSATSTATNILSISDGEVFKTAEPVSGYNPGGTILSGNFTMWRDVVVFPNNGGRINDSATTGTADRQRQYFIVVSGRGKAGHILGDGTALPDEATVYWSGVVKENFVPNVIREVNLTLRTGGSTTVPVTPTEYGGLTITVGAPTAWDSNIVNSDIIM